MKRTLILLLVAALSAALMNPKPVDARGNGWAIGGAILGGIILGGILGSQDRIVIGPVYPTYPPPVIYYPPPVYQPQQVWIVDRYEWRMVCPLWRPCYQFQVQIGHWEYR